MTRKQFLLTTAGSAGTANAAEGVISPPPRVLLVVAHPDDEYAFAATAYRIGKELGELSIRSSSPTAPVVIAIPRSPSASTAFRSRLPVAATRSRRSAGVKPSRPDGS